MPTFVVVTPVSDNDDENEPLFSPGRSPSTSRSHLHIPNDDIPVQEPSGTLGRASATLPIPTPTHAPELIASQGASSASVVTHATPQGAVPAVPPPASSSGKTLFAQCF